MGRIVSYGTKGTETGSSIVDRLYRPDGNRRGVLVAHGYAGRGYSWTDFPLAFLDALAMDGHPVLIPDMGGDLWGNATAVTKFGDGVTYLQGTLGAKTDKVLIFAYSMGTITAMNWAAANPSKVAGIVLAAPVDLQDIHDNNRGGYAAVIETAYGGTAAYNAVAVARNPAASANAANFTGLPIFVYYSNADTIVPTAVAQAYISNVGASAGTVLTAAHANIPASLPTAEVVAWLEAHA